MTQCHNASMPLCHLSRLLLDNVVFELLCMLVSDSACLYRLMEIESRLLPCGLHVVGSPPTAMEAIATLVNIAEIDRPENDPPTKGLPGILARSINRNMEEIYLNNNRVRKTPFSSSCCCALLPIQAQFEYRDTFIWLLSSHLHKPPYLCTGFGPVQASRPCR